MPRDDCRFSWVDVNTNVLFSCRVVEWVEAGGVNDLQNEMKFISSRPAFHYISATHSPASESAYSSPVAQSAGCWCPLFWFAGVKCFSSATILKASHTSWDWTYSESGVACLNWICLDGRWTELRKQIPNCKTCLKIRTKSWWTRKNRCTARKTLDNISRLIFSDRSSPENLQRPSHAARFPLMSPTISSNMCVDFLVPSIWSPKFVLAKQPLIDLPTWDLARAADVVLNPNAVVQFFRCSSEEGQSPRRRRMWDKIMPGQEKTVVQAL